MMLSPHRLGLWSLVVGLLFLSGSNHVATAQETEAVVESGRRQLWDFWSLLAMIPGGPPCPPGPLGDKCRQEREATQAPSGVSSDGFNSDSFTNSNSEYAGQQTNNNGIFGSSSQGFSWWMIATAGSAMAALVAVHMGQRKNRAGLLRHEMAGAVVRRNGAVSVFADEVIPQSSQKAIELGGIEVKGGYNLDAGPEGVEASVGGEIA